MGFILSIIAYLLFLPLAAINFFAVLIKFSKSRGFFRTINKFWYSSAVDIDKFGNYHYRTLWNMILIKNNSYLFGNPNETISSALGKNQKNKTLTLTGWLLVYLLWFIDVKYWFKGGHCLNSINYNV